MPGAASATRTPLLKRDQLIGYRGGLTSASPSRNWGGMRTASASSLQIYSAPATSLPAHSILPLWKQVVPTMVGGRSRRSAHVRGFVGMYAGAGVTVASVAEDTCQAGTGAGDDGMPGKPAEIADDMVCASRWCLDHGSMGKLCPSSSSSISYVGSCLSGVLRNPVELVPPLLGHYWSVSTLSLVTTAFLAQYLEHPQAEDIPPTVDWRPQRPTCVMIAAKPARRIAQSIHVSRLVKHAPPARPPHPLGTSVSSDSRRSWLLLQGVPTRDYL